MKVSLALDKMYQIGNKLSEIMIQIIKECLYVTKRSLGDLPITHSFVRA